MDAGRVPIQMDIMEIKNPLRSENMCAASLRIAREPLTMPPTTSIMRKIRAIADAMKSLQRTPFETCETSGRS